MTRKKRGYSLLEVLIVMSILGVIGVIAFPRMLSLTSTREDLKVKEILYHLKSAKTHAIKQHRITTFYIQGDQYGIKDSTGHVLMEEDLGTLTLDENSPRKEITFTAKGRPDFESSGKMILVGKKTYKIIITPVTGTIRWEKSL